MLPSSSGGPCIPDIKARLHRIGRPTYDDDLFSGFLNSCSGRRKGQRREGHARGVSQPQIPQSEAVTLYASVKSNVDIRIVAANADTCYARTVVLRSALYIRLYSVLHAAQILSPLELRTVLAAS